jgi:hypothetical protein
VINYLDLLKAELQQKSPLDQVPKVPKVPSNLETRPPDLVPKVPEPPFGTFGTSQSRHVSQTESRWLKPGDTPGEAAERATSIPRGYTQAELEAARRDAERLGYGGSRMLH